MQNLGVTDLSRPDLEEFLKQVEIKPKINHIHVGECNNMPLDLIQLAKDKHVELLHNGDCTSRLPYMCREKLKRDSPYYSYFNKGRIDTFAEKI